LGRIIGHFKVPAIEEIVKSVEYLFEISRRETLEKVAHNACRKEC
jgi:hypothetical protein